MNKISFLVAINALIFASACQQADKHNQNIMPKAPVAKKIPFEIKTHGDTRIDNYYWMRLSDEQKNAATPDSQAQQVLDYLNAENAFTDEVLAHTQDFQVKLFQEMKGRIKETDQSVPFRDNGYWYYTRFEQGQDYAFYCRKK